MNQQEINALIEANLRRQIELLEQIVEVQKRLLAFNGILTDAEIEALMNQEPIPEGWTEFSENETAFQRIKRQMNENQTD